MPLLTVRLSDTEHRDLKKLAEGTSMAELLRQWITAGKPDKTSDKTPVDMSTAAPLTAEQIAEHGEVTAIMSPWKSAEEFVAPAVSPLRNVHAECEKAERRSWQREQDARADYAAMLGLLRVIATAKEQAPGSRRYLVYEDTMTAILAITDAVHERERQAAEFAIDMSEPF